MVGVGINIWLLSSLKDRSVRNVIMLIIILAAVELILIIKLTKLLYFIRFLNQLVSHS